MRLYIKYVKVHIMSQLSYRKSFILLTIGQFFVPFIMFISMSLLFQRFGSIKGWSLYEVALCYGVINVAYSTSECIFRGFDSFSSLIRNGDFDRILLRPRNTIIQVLGSKFELSRIGRLIQGIIVLCFSLTHLDIHFTPLKTFTFIMMLIGGFIIFSGIYVIGATLCFITIEGIEVVNIFTDGGREMAKYPLGIYKSFVKQFFTFIIPFAIINYYPLMYILDKSENQFYAYTPLFSFLFILPCLTIWRLGVSKYTSTGS